MVDAAFLVDHGVTNLIEVDGLLYAPASDLWDFFIRFWLVRLAILALILFIVFVCLGIGAILYYSFLGVKQRENESDGEES